MLLVCVCHIDKRNVILLSFSKSNLKSVSTVTIHYTAIKFNLSHLGVLFFQFFYGIKEEHGAFVAPKDKGKFSNPGL